MPSVINTNVPSLNTQRNLGSSQAALNVSIQRLSTGLRVNSAKDDAAGLAIAERMNAQVRGLNVAARNANDGVSLAQTAEGSLGKIGEMVQRMRELAVQSSNATNSTEDRTALQAEVSQLKQEIDRVATTTNFNGTKLLDGSFASRAFQVGADAGQSIKIDSITDAQLGGMGAVKMQAHTAADLAATKALTNVNGMAIDLSAAADLAAAAVSINALSEQTGVTAEVVGTTMVFSSASAFTVAAGATVSNSAEAATAAGDLGELDIGSYCGAQKAILQADAAMKQISEARAQLGALQSRFESAVSNIQISSENATAARSRIMDTDFAAETANMTRSQILQQAGNAMLSQANQLPQQVLSLLR